MRHGVVGQMIDNRATQRHLIASIRPKSPLWHRRATAITSSMLSAPTPTVTVCSAMLLTFLYMLPHSAYTTYAASSAGIRDCPHSLTAPAHQQQATQTRPIAPRVIKPWPFHLRSDARHKATSSILCQKSQTCKVDGNMSHASQQYAFTEPRTVKRAQVKPSEQEHQTSSSAPRVSLAPAARPYARHPSSSSRAMVRRKPPRSLANSAFRAPRCTNCWRFWSVTDWSPALPSSAHGIGLKTFELGSAYSRQHHCIAGRASGVGASR